MLLASRLPLVLDAASIALRTMLGHDYGHDHNDSHGAPTGGGGGAAAAAVAGGGWLSSAIMEASSSVGFRAGLGALAGWGFFYGSMNCGGYHIVM